MMALITGAAGGLGRAMAGECASRGYSLILTDVRASALAPIQGGIERPVRRRGPYLRLRPHE